MILAAGRGTRLASIGLKVPKVLVEVGDRPLLESQLDYLSREGIERVVINAHHRAEAIESFARAYDGPAAITVVREPTLLGTAGAVRNALHLLGEESFFVLYGDVVIDQPLAPIAEAHRTSGACATLTVYESEAVEGKGTVLLDGEGWIRRFVEKAAPGPLRALVNAGLYLLEPPFVTRLSSGVELDFGLDVFPTALGQGARMFGYRLSQPVIDVGTPEGLELARVRAAASP